MEKRGKPLENDDPELAPKRSKKTIIKMLPNIRFDNIGYYPATANAKNDSRCHESSCQKRTRYLCEKCNK